MIRRFFIEFGRRTDWRPKTEEEYWRMRRTLITLFWLAWGAILIILFIEGLS